MQNKPYKQGKLIVKYIIIYIDINKRYFHARYNLQVCNFYTFAYKIS